MPVIGPNETVIGDWNYQHYIDPHINGEKKKCGTIPRDWKKYPHGSIMHAKPFDLPLIPESEWQPRLEAQIKAKAQLSDVRNQGMGGKPIPSRDQNGKGYSHTADTEVLTDKGWTPWPEWNGSDLLATVNPITRRMEFQAHTESHAYEYVDEIYHSTNRRLDFGVTRNHRMLVRKWDEKLRTLSNEYTMQRADSLGWYVGMMHAPEGGFIGTEMRKLAIDGDRGYDGDDLIALASLIVSDGYAGKDDNLVSFCCFHPDRYEQTAALARRVGFTEQPSRRGVWNKRGGVLWAWVRSNCYVGGELKAQSKKVPDFIKWANTRQIHHFLDYFGDQNHGKDAQTVFYSTSKRLIDDLQELHLRIAKRGTIDSRPARTAVMENGQLIRGGPSYVMVVGEVDRLCIDRKKHIETEKYKGLVYCATVPNGTLITRRNGSVLVSGNCWAHSSTSAAMIARAVMNEPYADLSAYMVACIIKGYQDEGGWGSESLEYIAQYGIPDSKYWPQQSMSRSNDNAEMRADAMKHRFTDWRDLDPNAMKAQLVTCLLMGFPVVSDFNWWSHSVCTIDLVSLNPFRTRIWNSWGDSWSENGTGVLEGSKAIPDSALCAIVMTPSPA